jgi:hypothetical protein
VPFGGEPPCPKRFNQFPFISCGVFQDRHTPSHFIDSVGIASSNCQKAEALSDLAGHVVLRVCHFTIKDFDSIDMLEERSLTGFFNIHLKLGNTEKEKSPEGMSGDHQASAQNHLLSKLLNHDDSLHILFVPENKDIPLIGRDLISTKDLDPSCLGHLFYLSRAP